MINAIGEGVIGLDSELRITFVNPKAEQLLDLTESELRGQLVCDVIYGPREASAQRPPDPCPLHEVVEQGWTAQVDDAHFTRRNGESFPVSFIASPIHEGGKVTGAALSFQDISLRRAAENALQHHMVELARINAELDEFTFVASHDLQEPLRKLLAFSDWLRRDLGEGRPPRVEQDLDFIVDAVNRMQGLVQDLLALSRAGRTSLSRQRVDLAAMAKQALGNLDVAVREKRAQIESDPLPEAWGDPTMLTQLYQNLIGNALKFSGPRPSQIRLTAREENGEWVFGVEDNGIGLKPEYAEQIFQPFKRLHGRGKYEGSGIGLSICRKVVERHGGHIWVESEEGRGAHFRFTLGGHRGEE
jgi:PAS domain S-box-containing protein